METAWQIKGQEMVRIQCDQNFFRSPIRNAPMKYKVNVMSGSVENVGKLLKCDGLIDGWTNNEQMDKQVHSCVSL